MASPRILLTIPPTYPDPNLGLRSLLFPKPSTLGIAQLAAVLREQGLTSLVLVERDLADLLRKVRVVDADAIEWIGISCHSLNFSQALRLAAALRGLLPRARVLLGGPHATFAPEQALEHAQIDLLIRGEGETPLTRLLAGDPVSDIPGVCGRRDGAPAVVPVWEEDDLDALPLPAYDLVGPLDPPLGGYLRKPVYAVAGSRGCLFNCSFCSRIVNGKGRRQRSVPRLLDDVRELVTRQGAREILFVDDIFLPQARDLTDFCQGLLERHNGLRWSCMSHFGVFDERLAGLIARAGCHMIGFGVESADPQLLRAMNKQLDLENARRQIAVLAAAGVRVRIHLVYGAPGETVQGMRRTLRYALGTAAALAVFSPLGVLPGTALERELKQQGRAAVVDWSKFEAGHPTSFVGLSDRDVFRNVRWSHLRFHARPAVWWRNRALLFNANFIRDALRVGLGLLGIRLGRGG